jgi:hypothetical protein
MRRSSVPSLAALGWLGSIAAAGVLLALLPATAAHAALGSTVDSVAADTAALRGQLHTTGYVAYDMHTISSGQLVVNEYATRAGQVFAITWHGPVPPNLQQLLGSYFSRFQSAAVAAHQANPGVHRVFTLSQSDLVIRAAGHLRAFGGIAYLPALVPTGVSVDQLQ